MTSTEFAFGSLKLPDNVQEKARALCDEFKLSPTQLFYKWEAWALNHTDSSDIPTGVELDQLATSIREKAAVKSVLSPGSRSKKRSTASPLYTPTPAPTAINIDDFFNYVPASEDAAVLGNGHDGTARKSPDLMPSSPQSHRDPESPEPVKVPETSKVALVSNENTFEDGISLPLDDDTENSYTQRAGSGRIEAALAPAMKPETPVESHRPAHVIAARLAVDNDVRYMNDDIASRVEALRTRVASLGAALARRVSQVNELEEAAKFPPEAFFVQSPDITRAFGRIRAELDDTDGVGTGRINDKSVLLESVDGNLVKLDLTRLRGAEWPLFLTPGAVVAVEGVNTNGRVFDVHAVYDNCIEDLTKDEGRHSSVEDKENLETLRNDEDEENAFINIIAASGPFTTASTLQYRPLDELLQIVERNKPDVVVLMGPFVDARHTLVNHALPVLFEDVFEKRVLARLLRSVQQLRQDGHRCSFIVLPSLDDVHHEFVCPQPAFRWPEGMTPDQDITFMSNPGVIEIGASNGALRAAVGMTSLPGVQDVSSDSICWNTDRFQAIASHFIKQRSFYPTFPPSAAVPLDSSLVDGLTIPSFKNAPSVDLLLCPSRLKAFAKCVDTGAVVVNPGLLCRGSGGGTYAEISFPLHRSNRPRPQEFNENRVEVNVVRL